MSLLENMYLKKICLVSKKIGNISVIVNEKNGFVCEKPEEYAKIVKAISKNYPLGISTNAYNDIVTIYNTKIMKEKYVDFYNSFSNQ